MRDLILRECENSPHWQETQRPFQERTAVQFPPIWEKCQNLLLTDTLRGLLNKVLLL